MPISAGIRPLTYTERLEEKVIYVTFDLLGLGRVAGIKGRVESK